MTKFCIVISQLGFKLQKLGAIFRLASYLFRTLSEFPSTRDQSQNEIKKTKAAGDYFLHSVKKYSTSKFQSNHENSIAIQ